MCRYIQNQNYKDALSLINSLLRELKRLDDKMILTEVHLLESRVNYSLANMPKAKVSLLSPPYICSQTRGADVRWGGFSQAALTSARTAANSIYCPPMLQAQLDLQSGVLHAEEKDYKTGYVVTISLYSLPTRSWVNRFHSNVQILVLLRSVRRVVFTRGFEISHGAQIHVVVQDHVGTRTFSHLSTYRVERLTGWASLWMYSPKMWIVFWTENWLRSMREPIRTRWKQLPKRTLIVLYQISNPSYNNTRLVRSSSPFSLSLAWADTPWGSVSRIVGWSHHQEPSLGVIRHVTRTKLGSNHWTLLSSWDFSRCRTRQTTR